MAQPPLLFQEGNTLHHDLRSLKKNAPQKTEFYTLCLCVFMRRHSNSEMQYYSFRIDETTLVRSRRFSSFS